MQESCQLLRNVASKNYLRLQRVIILIVKALRVIMRKNYQTEKIEGCGVKKLTVGIETEATKNREQSLCLLLEVRSLPDIILEPSHERLPNLHQSPPSRPDKISRCIHSKVAR